MKAPGRLPRLPDAFYRGPAIIHWTLPTFDRATGWLDERRHLLFRETLLHAAARELLLCPIYCLMPDHIHLIWLGLASESDQRNAMAFMRTHLEKHLHPAKFQPQAFDHVLRDHERERGAFARVVQYIADNPVRGKLAEDSSAWPYTGCVVPGCPRLDPREERFWDVFWKIHAKLARSE